MCRLSEGTSLCVQLQLFSELPSFLLQPDAGLHECACAANGANYDQSAERANGVYLRGTRRLALYRDCCSWHWEKGRVHPGQAAGQREFSEKSCLPTSDAHRSRDRAPRSYSFKRLLNDM
ncbi:hypothetical protein EYF80_053021 [Liparis tanakae]|uniref:Uncharacterized protein n=1 Tax=Liparis tanakae TaxID=230148 RepID=A0A4Z2F6Y2_9TELE|nr:hypothetical protein EYF80_053021 [Liparis tanakae]